jgi:hypothetical protein
MINVTSQTTSTLNFVAFSFSFFNFNKTLALYWTGGELTGWLPFVVLITPSV